MDLASLPSMAGLVTPSIRGKEHPNAGEFCGWKFGKGVFLSYLIGTYTKTIQNMSQSQGMSEVVWSCSMQETAALEPGVRPARFDGDGDDYGSIMESYGTPMMVLWETNCIYAILIHFHLFYALSLNSRQLDSSDVAI